MKDYVTGFISGASLIAGALMLMGANKGDVIKTGEIQIFDRETGKIALHLFANSGSGGLVISRTDDTENSSKIVLGCESNGGSVAIYNSKNKIVGGLVPDTNDGGTLTLNNEFGENRCYLGADSKNNGLIQLFDSYGYFGWQESGKN
ncbi:MAG: hypothetical protein QGH24_01735 [Candidatus Marinimicrobia bacterium]|nr:hypothetical protein [Candidatus Neomarinimicrobiota bacterium]